jgi:multidrug efflux pump subunit AcrA (membrane-fusion protein)
VARYAALLAYTRITAPYDGIVTARNVSVGELVRPGASDGQSDGMQGSEPEGTPMFVLARMDKLMFVVGVPELDAGNVNDSTPVNISVRALGIPEIQTTVTRISSSIRLATRTLTAQVDLPNPQGQLMPGMYATGTLKIERRGVLAVPASGIVAQGNHATCFFVIDQHAVQQEVEQGLSDANWTQLLRKKVRSGSQKDQWVPISPDDRVIVRDVSQVTDGARVEIAKGKDDGDEQSGGGSSESGGSENGAGGGSDNSAGGGSDNGASGDGSRGGDRDTSTTR